MTTESYHPKPGDKVVRVRRLKAHPLRRIMGIPALFSTTYGDVGSSIYYALGLVAMVALGATPVALGIAAIFFVCTALTYAEGTAMIPEAGGSSTFARHAFNDMSGFISGWALMFGYIVTIAISAYTIPSYLAFFWPVLKESAFLGTTLAMGVVTFLILINVLGVRESSVFNLGLAILSLLTQLLLIILAFIFLFSPSVFFERIVGYWPSTIDLFFGVAIAAIAYTGVETASQMVEEARRPRVSVPRTLTLLIFVVVIIFGGICAAAFSAMTPEELATDWAKDPVAGIAHGILYTLTPERAVVSGDLMVTLVLTRLFEVLHSLLPVLISVLAATILMIATNAGLMGISRLAFSLGRFRLIPPELSRIHPRFRTPYPSIVLFGLVAILLLAPGFFWPDVFEKLGGLYAFGSMLSFSFAHAAIIALRIRKPNEGRPYKLRWNIKVAGRELPFSAIFGLLGTFSIWIVILVSQPISRYVGFAWMIGGVVMYLVYRVRTRVKGGGEDVAATPGSTYNGRLP